MITYTTMTRIDAYALIYLALGFGYVIGVAQTEGPEGRLPIVRFTMVAIAVICAWPYFMYHCWSNR